MTVIPVNSRRSENRSEEHVEAAGRHEASRKVPKRCSGLSRRILASEGVHILASASFGTSCGIFHNGYEIRGHEVTGYRKGGSSNFQSWHNLFPFEVAFLSGRRAQPAFPPVKVTLVKSSVVSWHAVYLHGLIHSSLCSRMHPFLLFKQGVDLMQLRLMAWNYGMHMGSKLVMGVKQTAIYIMYIHNVYT